MSLFLIFMLIALALFLLAAFNVPSKIGLVPLGLAFWVLAILIGGARTIAGV
jgi:hypothetical protein